MGLRTCFSKGSCMGASEAVFAVNDRVLSVIDWSTCLTKFTSKFQLDNVFLPILHLQLFSQHSKYMKST